MTPNEKKWDDWDWDEDSLAVIACDTKGHGVVLWTAGPHVAYAIEGESLYLDELGLDNAPMGISIWEGKYLWRQGDTEQQEIIEPSGKFRQPTDEEWKAIREGCSS